MLKIETERLSREWCNWLKLVAAVLVAVSHYSTVVVVNNHWSDSHFLRFFCQGGYIGVAIFFFLSGYGLMESDLKRHLGWMDFVKRRLSKVYLPFLMVSFVWIPCYYLLLSTQPMEWRTFLYDIVWGGRDAVVWFIKILFMMYAVFYAFTALWRRNRFWAHVVLVGGLGLCMAVSAYTFGAFSVMSIPLFGIGVYTSLYKRSRLMYVPVSYWLIALLGVVGATYFLITHDNIAAHIAVNAVVIIGVVSLVYVLNSITPPLLLSSSWLSATFVLYIVHMKVLDVLTSQWGYISFTTYVLSVCVVVYQVNRIKMWLKI